MTTEKKYKRDPRSGALILPKKEHGKHIDTRIMRKILLEIYRVLPDESKQSMKPKVRQMLELL